MWVGNPPIIDGFPTQRDGNAKIVSCLRVIMSESKLGSWIHDDVIKWKHFPRDWSFVRGIHRSRWIPHTKASDAELWCFLWSAPEKRLSKQSWGWWFETPSHPLWRHCNGTILSTQLALMKLLSVNKILLRLHLFRNTLLALKFWIQIALVELLSVALKRKDRQFDNFVVPGGTLRCNYNNSRCQQWRQSCQIDDLVFSEMKYCSKGVEQGVRFSLIVVTLSTHWIGPTIWQPLYLTVQNFAPRCIFMCLLV